MLEVSITSFYSTFLTFSIRWVSLFVVVFQSVSTENAYSTQMNVAICTIYSPQAWHPCYEKLICMWHFLKNNHLKTRLFFSTFPACECFLISFFHLYSTDPSLMYSNPAWSYPKSKQWNLKHTSMHQITHVNLYLYSYLSYFIHVMDHFVGDQ